MVAKVTVALVRGDRRRGALAQALHLIAPQLRAAMRAQVLIKPNLVSHQSQLPSTCAAALSATLDAVLAAGAREVTVAEGATDASAAFERFGMRSEAWGRPVRFMDLNREETDWVPLALRSIEGTPLEARLSRTLADAPFRVSLALAKTHVTARATFSIKNMLSSIHPADRVMMHGHGAGNGYGGWKGRVVDWLKQDTWLVCACTRLLGGARAAQAVLTRKAGRDGWRRLSQADRQFLRSVAVMNHNLAALCAAVRPDLSVIDAFVAMEGEGPRHGRARKLGAAIAGTDPVAVDAVAAAIMGFDPREIGYLQQSQQAGLGIADLDAITIVGDPIARVAQRCARHSNDYVHRHWDRFSSSPAPARTIGAGPHRRPARADEAHRS